MTDRPRPIDLTCAVRYVWGPHCDGWRLLDDPALTVIEERVLTGGGEQRHAHSRARQVFYVPSGAGTLECDGAVIELRAGQGMHVPPGMAHRFVNRSGADVPFARDPGACECRRPYGSRSLVAWISHGFHVPSVNVTACRRI